MTTNPLPIIQSLWIGDALSTMEKLSISSFLKNGHPYHLYVYDETKGIPEGVVVKEANEIVPREKIFKYKQHDSHAGFSNMFRYKLLFEKGSYWVDTDVVCLKPFASESSHVFASEEVPHQGVQVTNCVIKSPSGSEIMDYCYRECLKRDPENLSWGDTGPRLLSCAVHKFGAHENVADPAVFCPVNWWNWKELIRNSTFTDLKEHLRACRVEPQAIHLWNEMWRRSKSCDKNAPHPCNSIYELLKHLYLNGKEPP